MKRGNINRKLMGPGAEPNWIIRRGQYMVVIVFLLAILFSSFYSFNETIKGKVRVTSNIPPAEIIAKHTGKLTALNYRSGDTVGEGVVLGIIENSANESDVEYLKKRISKSIIFESIDSLKSVFPSNLRLGNIIQPSYQSFLATYQEVIIEKLMEDNVLIQGQKWEELRSQKRIAENKNQELFLAQRALDLQKRNLDRQSGLFEKGVISHHDLEKVESEFLLAQQRYEIIIQQVEQINIGLTSIEKERKLAESSSFKATSSGEIKLEAMRETLLNSILDWEEKYLLISPIDGKLSLKNVWGTFQNIEEGELVFVVYPITNYSLFGICQVPVRNSGKIKEGQNAYLKLDNYPHREWGILKSKVESISDIPGGDNNDFLVFLSISNLKTSYGKQLKFNRELIGEAEIVLEETSIIERIFYEFRHLWTSK